MFLSRGTSSSSSKSSCLSVLDTELDLLNRNVERYVPRASAFTIRHRKIARRIHSAITLLFISVGISDSFFSLEVEREKVMGMNTRR